MIANVYRSQIHMDKRETYNYREISLAKNKTQQYLLGLSLGLMQSLWHCFVQRHIYFHLELHCVLDKILY